MNSRVDGLLKGGDQFYKHSLVRLPGYFVIDMIYQPRERESRNDNYSCLALIWVVSPFYFQMALCLALHPAFLIVFRMRCKNVSLISHNFTRMWLLHGKIQLWQSDTAICNSSQPWRCNHPHHVRQNRAESWQCSSKSNKVYETDAIYHRVQLCLRHNV